MHNSVDGENNEAIINTLHKWSHLNAGLMPSLLIGFKGLL